MKLYGGIDLHSNNSMLVLSDEEDQVVYRRRLPNEIAVVLAEVTPFDSGLFEMNLHDERYLPFEGSGAISTWRVELPEPSLAQFDYKTISDLILHLRYTARDAGGTLRQYARQSAEDQLKTEGALLVAVKDELPAEWARAAASADTVPLNISLTTNMLPYLLSNLITKRRSVKVFVATPVPDPANPGDKRSPGSNCR